MNDPSQGAVGRGGHRLGQGRRSFLHAPPVLLLAAILVVGATAVSVAGAGTGSSPAGAASPARRIGHAPRLPAGARAVSRLSDTSRLTVDVTLQPRDPAALTTYATDVATPGSASYHRYLDPAQFAARFGPTASVRQAVTSALRQQGLHPGRASANGLSIPVTATAGQLASAFATSFERYRVRTGRIAYANTSAPQVPGDVAPYVQGVVGLDNLVLPQPAALPRPTDQPAAPAPASAWASASTRPVTGSSGSVAPAAATGGPQPCAQATSVATSQGSYTTDQLASAYSFSPLYRAGDFGAGQTVALYELQGYTASDITAFQTCYGTDASVTTVSVDGGPLRNSGVGEATVDIEEVVSFAPAANVLVYEGPNDDPGDYDTYNAMISQDRASVISTSWGECEPEEGSAAATAENTLFEEASVQGQGIFAASGDEGSEDCVTSMTRGNSLAVDDPASQPFVTGVGGTSWAAAGTPPDETAWNDGPTCCWGAGGGGISSLWAMPSYQSSAGDGVVGSRSSRTPCGAPSGSYCREVPDVSALAGPYPYVEYVSGSWDSWGGTSLAAPLWASIVALADSSPSCAGQSVGFANPALYTAATSAPGAFHDVTTGNNDLTGSLDGQFPAGTGYDMATGLGTPDAALLAAALCPSQTAATIVVTNPGGQAGSVGTPVALTLSATDSVAGRILTFAASGLPAGLHIDPATGEITGSPTTAEQDLVTVTASDGTGASGATSFGWSVANAFTSPDRATATIGATFSQTVTASGAPTKITRSGKLPKGIRWKKGVPSSTVAGTAKAKAVPGSYGVVFTATYGKGKTAVRVTQSFTLTLVAA